MTKNDVPPNDLAELILEVMPRAMQSIREDMRRERGENLTVPQFRILAAINRGVTCCKHLGDELGVSEAAISRMLLMLSKQGLIEKKSTNDDRRKKMLTLSLKGQKRFRAITQSAKERMSLSLDALAIDQRSKAIEGLLVIKDFISAQNHTRN